MPALEKCYRVKEIARMWGVSRQTVWRTFVDEHGVLATGTRRTLHKRPHVTLLIPESVLHRVKSRFEVGAAQS